MADTISPSVDMELGCCLHSARQREIENKTKQQKQMERNPTKTGWRPDLAPGPCSDRGQEISLLLIEVFPLAATQRATGTEWLIP